MLIQSSGLEFVYPAGPKLRFPDLQLEKGEASLILGPSGCGKTTFLQLLAGLRLPSAGSICLQNQELRQLSEKQRDSLRARTLGFVFQQSYFLPYLSILENVLLPGQLLGHKKDTDQALQWLDRLQLLSIARKKPAQCSIGEQQRASVARVLLQNPGIIFADEPTSALDDNNAGLVGQLLRESAEKNNTALLVVSHDHRLQSQFPKIIQL